MTLLRSRQTGFSLVELSIVLVIVSLLVGGLMITLSAQRENIAVAETKLKLDEIRDALLGYVAANGRLPCPAAPGTTGVEAPVGGGACARPRDGLLPGITLGLTPTDQNGYVLDGWGTPIRYAVTSYSHGAFCPNGCFTTANGIRTAWNGSVGTLVLAPDLQVCNTASNIQTPGPLTATCAPNAELATSAAVVVLSRGPNGGIAAVSNDEQANDDGDRLFVSHLPSPAGPNEFDDLVIWISPNVLYNRLIAAGRLP